MSIRYRAEEAVQIIEAGLNGWPDDIAYRNAIQSMIHDLGGRHVPVEASLSAATNYLLMLWLARGEWGSESK